MSHEQWKINNFHALLKEGCTIKQAAARVGVPAPTAYKWLQETSASKKDTSTNIKVTTASEKATPIDEKDADERIRASALDAVEALTKTLDDPDATPAGRQRAANALLAHFRKLPPAPAKAPEIDVDWAIFSEGQLDMLDTFSAMIRGQPVDATRLPWVTPRDPARWGMSTKDAAQFQEFLRRADEYCSAEALRKIQ